QPAWDSMVNRLETVPTQAFQLWLTKPIDDLRWPVAGAVIGGYVEPFDTIADMRHLVEIHRPDALASILAFCNVYPTEGLSATGMTRAARAESDEAVRRNAIAFLNNDFAQICPGALKRYPNSFRWDLLAGDPEGTGEQRFDSQYWRANVEPSDR